MGHTNNQKTLRMRFCSGIIYALLVIAVTLFPNCTGGNYDSQINKILDWEKSNGELSNEQFDEVFKLIEANPETFNIDFGKINRFHTVMSTDKKIKAYSIDIANNIYGWRSECRVILQYDVDDEVKTVLLPDTIQAIEDIYSLEDNRYLFIGSSRSIHQGVYMSKQAYVYVVGMHEAKKLSNVFCAGDDKTDEVEVYYQQELSFKDDEIYVLLAYRNDGIIEGVDEIDNLAIIYNQLKKDLYVAETGTAAEGTIVMTGKFKHYHWDGNRFLDITLTKPLELFNDDYYIRIEQENNGSCTYMSWNGGKKIGKPDLIIRDGVRQFVGWKYKFPYDEWLSDDESSPDSEEFTFQNNGYTYRYTTGWSRGYIQEELEVYDPDGELIYFGSFKQIE